MTPVGPATESGAPVVPSAPTAAAERLEYLVRLAMEGYTVANTITALGLTSTVRERMAQAAQAWELEVADLRAEVAQLRADIRDRIEARSVTLVRVDQLEQTVERLSFALAEATQTAQAASERHAIDSGEQRQTIAALAAQLVREMRRGGA